MTSTSQSEPDTDAASEHIQDAISQVDEAAPEYPHLQGLKGDEVRERLQIAQENLEGGYIDDALIILESAHEKVLKLGPVGNPIRRARHALGGI